MSGEAHRLVDLFSGLGGLSLGLEQPDRLNGIGDLKYEGLTTPGNGFRTVLAVDNNEDAAATVEHHFPDAEVINEDITQIESFTEWSDADVVVGGPPCQGFSNLNSTKTDELDDDRNQLWEEFMRTVNDIQPDLFLIENVPRFLDSKEGSEVVAQAEEMGYNTVVDRLWAHKYGVPQRRHRAFIIGSRLGTPVFPATTSEPVRTVRDAIADLPTKPNNENWHNTRNFSEKTIKRMEAVPEGGNRFDIPEELLPECWKGYESGGTDLFGRLWMDEPAVTIRTGFHKPMKGRHLHPSENRAITLREGARLQTIPDDYTIQGRQHQWRVAQQIGNAVPPKLAYHLGWAIEAHLQGLEGGLRVEAEEEDDPFAWPERVAQDELEDHVKRPAKA
ncbi:DNA (cytosine-5)-methyltransferase 1 [Halogeometricum rufum]|uniref:DNA (cytosine-5-)-methyltransferase n=1 Tax=Halogeometricum rufum TaxID=553469 RepID=A0A1I6G129_9EURY|nr:DNA cytosine methyltransferase [Halogeometricum rufum]SFR35850.1 DNA (cytosine-5)-methyltransferase 1 [Halogeometricum rufum]